MAQVSLRARSVKINHSMKPDFVLVCHLIHFPIACVVTVQIAVSRIRTLLIVKVLSIDLALKLRLFRQGLHMHHSSDAQELLKGFMTISAFS